MSRAERVLVIRLGAIGDMIGITPLLRYLKQQGDEVYVLTKEIGEQILRYNPNVDKLILYKGEIEKMFPGLEEPPDYKLGELFKATAEAYTCARTINLCESWEVKLARCPSEPNFKYPKNIAREICDKNYYEFLFEIAFQQGVKKSSDRFVEYIKNSSPKDFYKPEMFFTEAEEIEMNNWFVDFRKAGKKIILWGLSGSAANKTFPYVPEVIDAILEKYLQVCFLTIGDEVCQILEIELQHERIFNRSGLWSIRQSCLATKYADLVIAPDTGILHASGCWETPKIGILNHTSIENITKHFKNDYSLHASEGKHPFFGEISCSPCFKIHYAKKITCNMAEVKGTSAPVCQVYGIPPEKLAGRIEQCLNL